MSTRQPSDDPDVDVNALHREVGADSVAGTPTRRMQTRQQRREAEVAALPQATSTSGKSRDLKAKRFCRRFCVCGFVDAGHGVCAAYDRVFAEWAGKWLLFAAKQTRAAIGYKHAI